MEIFEQQLDDHHTVNFVEFHKPEIWLMCKYCVKSRLTVTNVKCGLLGIEKLLDRFLF